MLRGHDLSMVQLDVAPNRSNQCLIILRSKKVPALWFAPTIKMCLSHGAATGSTVSKCTESCFWINKFPAPTISWHKLLVKIEWFSFRGKSMALTTALPNLDHPFVNCGTCLPIFLPISMYWKLYAHIRHIDGTVWDKFHFKPKRYQKLQPWTIPNTNKSKMMELRRVLVTVVNCDNQLLQ